MPRVYAKAHDPMAVALACYRQFFRNNRLAMTRTLLGLSNHAAAAKMAEEFLKAAVDPVGDT